MLSKVDLHKSLREFHQYSQEKKPEKVHHLTYPCTGCQETPTAETRPAVMGMDKRGVPGLALSKTVNRPELKDGLVVVTMYFPSELVTGVPVEVPLMAAVVKSSEPSAISSAVTNELHS